MDMATVLCLKWITNKELLYGTWDSAQCYVAVWRGGEFGREWIHVHVWLNPLLFTRNCHNIVNWLHPNTKYKVKKKPTPGTRSGKTPEPTGGRCIGMQLSKDKKLYLQSQISFLSGVLSRGHRQGAQPSSSCLG